MSEEVRTILVVDDEPLVQSVLERLLHQHGYRVLLAEDGHEAMAQLERDHADAVLLDVMMPEKDGIETLMDLKQRYPSLPVIMVSGGGLEGRCDFLSIAERLGADATVRKPARGQLILDVVERYSRPYKRPVPEFTLRFNRADKTLGLYVIAQLPSIGDAEAKARRIMVACGFPAAEVWNEGRLLSCLVGRPH